MKKNQENNQDPIKQEIRDLLGIRDHGRKVEALVKVLCNIHYRLGLLSRSHIDYKDLPESRQYHEKKLKALLNQDFQYLEFSDQKNYISTIGSFNRLFNALKARYEKDVLKNEENITLNPNQ